MKLTTAILIRLNALYVLKDFLSNSEEKINSFDAVIDVGGQQICFDEDSGICGNLREIIESVHGYDIAEKVSLKLNGRIYNINSKWKHYSGEEDYPICTPKGYDGDESDYYCYVPKYIGRQLKKRRQLVDHQINHLQKLLHKKATKDD